jgi:hypothetical protein
MMKKQSKNRQISIYSISVYLAKFDNIENRKVEKS